MRCFSYRDGPPLPIEASHYPADGSPALFIGEGQDRVVLTVCAIDLGFDKPADGYVYIRDWGQGAGVADALVAQNVAELVARVAINAHGSKLAIMKVLP